MTKKEARKKLDNGLTAQQDVFCRHVASGETVTESARQAGYNGSDGTLAATGSRLLRNDKVKARVAELAESAADHATLDASYVLAGLMRNAELGREQGIDGKPVALGASTQSLGLLGKHLRLFVDRTAVEFGDDVQRVLKAVVDIIDDEVGDSQTRGRIAARLLELARGVE